MNFRTVCLVALAASAASAQDLRVRVSIENLAPSFGTFQTPVWVGVHNGMFDSYDGGTLASSLPIPGSVALERLAEDGSTGPISADFTTLGFGRFQATVAGPNGPIAPGERGYVSFLLDPNNPLDRYFSYASMVIPSNDAFVANGSPLAHPLFDNNGNFIGSDFFVAGPNAVNDAGTEVNDEIPANTAFFGQMAPNTGVTESQPIIAHPGFLPGGSGGILDSARFRDGQFTLSGYPFLRFGFRAAPAVRDFRIYNALSLGAQEVPPTPSGAIGISGYGLLDNGERLFVVVQAIGMQDLTAAHLHLGATGQNGPVVADLLADRSAPQPNPTVFFTVNLDADSMTGPLAGFPLDELVRRIEAGEIYLNLHSSAFPAGEIRGQLSRLQ